MNALPPSRARGLNRLAVPLALGLTLLMAVAQASPPPTAAAAAAAKKVYVCPRASDGQEYDQPGFCGMDERIEKAKQMRVAVLMFKGAQVIDYAGPMEIFAQTGAKVFTVAPTPEVRTSALGILQFKPDYDFSNAPPADVLLVPGGNAAEIALNPEYKAWLRQRVDESQLVLSVCTGAFVLGEAGLLDGLPGATTFASAIDELGRRYPKLQRVVKDRRVVDTGKIITTGGLSAGMDGALHVVERWMGRVDAKETARGLEYDWNPDRKGSYAELAAQRMPSMWHAMVPQDTPFDRYYEDGNTRQWEARAHVGAVAQPGEFLDHSKAYLQSEGWTPVSAQALTRSYQRQADGQDWRLTVALAKDATEPAFTMSVKVASRATAGRKTPGTPRQRKK